MDVLLADDNEDYLFLQTRVLENEGYTVHVARDGMTALRLATAHNFALILLDWEMPDLSGCEVTRRLRRSGFTRPIVMVSAHAMPGFKRTARVAGCCEYLTKPLDYDNLKRVIKTLVDQHICMHHARFIPDGPLPDPISPGV